MAVTVAFILLAHEALDAAGALARALAAGGRPVAVHVDARADIAPFDAAAKGAALIRLPRRAAPWGMYPLVGATLDGVAALLASGRDFSHVALVSGADLPLRPLAELDGFAAANPGLDLIEARTPQEGRRAPAGLEAERLTLRHPFPWRSRRRLFDASVRLQRRLGMRRRLPTGFDPAFGSQWWLLSRATLARIMADPQLPALCRFHRRVWIPDECFFQSLARRWSENRRNLSPTLARFDAEGRPFVFYDDHADLLALSDHFLVRKADPGAAALRRALLDRAAAPARNAGFEGRAPEEEFARARRRRLSGRGGVLSAAGFPAKKGHAPVSAYPYGVIGGVGGETADLIAAALRRAGGYPAHGRLFAPEGARLAAGASLAAGCLPAAPAVRDFDPGQYIVNLARGAAGGPVSFCLAVEDGDVAGPFIAADPGARIIWFRGAWALDLFRRAGALDAAGLAARAAAAGAAERALLARIRSGGAALEEASAAMLIDAPEAALAAMLRTANAAPASPAPTPDFAPPGWRGARPVLRRLQKAGVAIEAGLLPPRGGA